MARAENHPGGKSCTTVATNTVHTSKLQRGTSGGRKHRYGLNKGTAVHQQGNYSHFSYDLRQQTAAQHALSSPPDYAPPCTRTGNNPAKRRLQNNLSLAHCHPRPVALQASTTRSPPGRIIFRNMPQTDTSAQLFKSAHRVLSVTMRGTSPRAVVNGIQRRRSLPTKH